MRPTSCKYRQQIFIIEPRYIGSSGGPIVVQGMNQGIHASVNIKSGKESIANESVQSSLKYEIEIRYRDDITSQWQIEYKGQLLDIVSVYDPDQRGRRLIIEAVKHIALDEQNV